ncbi:MAG: hypothetical protein HYW25_03770 [Candidatus Aenigmarchaeota archaeon]|nr:hypothetical protein [Candidatus Aenigmarchaeota archaeon]
MSGENDILQEIAGKEEVVEDRSRHFDPLSRIAEISSGEYSFEEERYALWKFNLLSPITRRQKEPQPSVAQNYLEQSLPRPEGVATARRVQEVGRDQQDIFSHYARFCATRDDVQDLVYLLMMRRHDYSIPLLEAPPREAASYVLLQERAASLKAENEGLKGEYKELDERFDAKTLQLLLEHFAGYGSSDLRDAIETLEETRGEDGSLVGILYEHAGRIADEYESLVHERACSERNEGEEANLRRLINRITAQELRPGMNVRITRAINGNRYSYGGTTDTVPIGTEASIASVREGCRGHVPCISLRLPSGIRAKGAHGKRRWSVHPDEIEVTVSSFMGFDLENLDESGKEELLRRMAEGILRGEIGITRTTEPHRPGSRVSIRRAYHGDAYYHGGSTSVVPLGTEGTIEEVLGENKICLNVLSGRWHVHPSEIESLECPFISLEKIHTSKRIREEAERKGIDPELLAEVCGTRYTPEESEGEDLNEAILEQLRDELAVDTPDINRKAEKGAREEISRRYNIPEGDMQFIIRKDADGLVMNHKCRLESSLRTIKTEIMDRMSINQAKINAASSYLATFG